MSVSLFRWYQCRGAHLWNMLEILCLPPGPGFPEDPGYRSWMHVWMIKHKRHYCNSFFFFTTGSLQSALCNNCLPLKSIFFISSSFYLFHGVKKKKDKFTLCSGSEATCLSSEVCCDVSVFVSTHHTEWHRETQRKWWKHRETVDFVLLK